MNKLVTSDSFCTGHDRGRIWAPQSAAGRSCIDVIGGNGRGLIEFRSAEVTSREQVVRHRGGIVRTGLVDPGILDQPWNRGGQNDQFGHGDGGHRQQAEGEERSCQHQQDEHHGTQGDPVALRGIARNEVDAGTASQAPVDVDDTVTEGVGLVLEPAEALVGGRGDHELGTAAMVHVALVTGGVDAGWVVDQAQTGDVVVGQDRTRGTAYQIKDEVTRGDCGFRFRGAVAVVVGHGRLFGSGSLMISTQVPL